MPQLAIDRLALRMPSADAARGQRLAVAVAERMAAHTLVDSGDLGRLEVRVPWPDGASDDRLADAIAEAILRAMHRAT